MCAATAALNLAMALIAWRLPPDVRLRPGTHHGPLIEWHVLILSFTLFLYSFGYGGITSFVALYADANGVVPKSIFFTAFALTILVTRPISGPLSDRIGHRRVFLPCLGLIVAGLALLALDGSRRGLISAAIVFGAGLGSAYPAYAAYVMQHVPDSRRGAAFGSILAAFDTGIGTGSVTTGWIVQRSGFSTAYGVVTCRSARLSRCETGPPSVRVLTYTTLTEQPRRERRRVSSSPPATGTWRSRPSPRAARSTAPRVSTLP